MKGKQFRCDCGWAFHSLVVDIDDSNENDVPFICFSVVNAPADLGLLQRLKMAFWVILGREHVLSEVWLHRQDAKEFGDFIYLKDK